MIYFCSQTRYDSLTAIPFMKLGQFVLQKNNSAIVKSNYNNLIGWLCQRE